MAPVTIPQVYAKKLQLYDWLIATPINETSATISITYFTKHSVPDKTTLETKLELVNMDEALGKAVQHRNAIGHSLTKSYKITSVHDAVITVSSLLSFLLNLADWIVAENRMSQEKPALCHFLELVIKLLLSRLERA